MKKGVIFCFLFVFIILTIFPSVSALLNATQEKQKVDIGKWQRVRIEFEFESRNFRDHGHSPDGCDVIVCWQHNWRECPENIEVIELKSVIGTLATSEE